VFATGDGGLSWSPSRLGITDPVVTGLTASPNFSRDHVVFASADDGVFRSSDGGSTWSNSSSGLSGHSCRTVALDPGFANDSTAYVATDGGVFRSPYGGTQWFPTLVTKPVISLAAGPAGLVLAGLSNGGLERSVDEGQTWTSVNGFPAGRVALSLAIAGNDTTVVGTDQGIWLSQDGGATWAASNVTTDRVDAVALSPSFPVDGRAVAGSAGGSGAYRTADGGAVWSPAASSSPRFISSLSAETGSGGFTVLAGGVGDGVFRSSDGGSTWSSVNSGLAAASVAQISLAGGQLLEGGLGGVSTRSLQGTWQDLPVGSAFVNAVARSQRHIFIGTEDQGLRVSYDGGFTFQAASLSDGRVSAVGLSPSYASDSTLLVAEDHVYTSSDSGLTWTISSGMEGNDVRRIRFSRTFATDRTAFATTVSHGVYRTVDGGLTWQGLAGGLPSGQISDVLVSRTFSRDAIVYAATSGDGVYISRDAGDAWSPLATQPEQRVVSALGWTADGSLVAGTEKGAFILSARVWTRIAGRWDSYVTDLQSDASNGMDVLYAGTLGDGVWELPLAQPPTPTVSASPAPTSTLPAPPTRQPTAVPPSPPHPPKFIRAWVMPKPLHPGGIALLRIQGPSWARVDATMTAAGWRKSQRLQLGAHGIGAIGFLAPSHDFHVLVVAHIGKRTGQTQFLVRLTR
jgi:photosystem II stability/assembly factor-like uncharacterized protein